MPFPPRLPYSCGIFNRLIYALNRLSNRRGCYKDSKGMNLKFKFSIIAVLLLALLSACGLFDEDEPETIEVSATPFVDAGKPGIEINAPLTGSEVAVNSEVLVYAIARDSVGVTKIELRENGAVINTVTSPNPSGQTELASLQGWTPTTTGTFTLEVVAYRNEIASDPAAVNVTVVQTQTQVQNPVATPVVVAPVQTADTSCRVRILLDKLAVFAQPSNSSQVIQSVAIGEVLPLLGRTPANEWFEVNVRGQRGWIDAAYTSRLGNCDLLPVTGEVVFIPTTAPTNLPPVVVQPTSTTVGLVPQQGAGGGVATADPRVCSAVITTDNVAGRSNPGENNTVVVTLRANTTWGIFQRTGDGSWWQVSVNGVLAWIPSGSLAIRGECSGVLVATASPVPNRPPVIATIPAQVMETGETVTITVVASDPDADGITLSLAMENQSVVTATLQSANTISLTPRGPGLTTVTVTASDSRGGTTTRTFAVSVTEPTAPNQPPLINPVNDVMIVSDAVGTVALQVADPEEQAVSLNVTIDDQAIAAIVIDENNVLSIAPLAVGTTRVVVTASDNAGGTANIAFNVEVVAPSPIPNTPPVIETIENQVLELGETAFFEVTVSDAEDETVTLSTTTSDNLVAVSAIVDGEVAITANGGGEAEITLTAQDSDGATASMVFTVTVDLPNEAPTLQEIQDVSLAPGESRALAVVTSDTEGSPTLSAESSDENVATAEMTAGQIVVEGVDDGTAEITVTAEDADGLTATTTFTVTVQTFATPVNPADNRPPVIDAINTQQVLVGETILVPVNVTDPEGAEVVLTASSAAEDIALATVNSQGGLEIVGIAPGQATINLIADDTQGKRTSTTFQVTVSTSQAENLPPVVEPIDDVTLNIGESATVEVEATDPEGFNMFFSGITSADQTVATVRSDGAGNLDVDALAPGRTRITVVVSDGQGGTATVSFNVIVREAATATPDAPPVVQPFENQTILVGDSVTLLLDASDPEGTQVFFAEIESSAETIATAESDGAGNLIVTGVAPGQAEINLVIEDSTGNQTPTSFTVTVEEPTPTPNDAPVVSPIAEQTVEVGEAITVPVSANDPEGTQVFFADLESSAETIATVESDGAGNLLITGISAGQAEIMLVVEDGGGQQTAVSFTVVVTFTPTETPAPGESPIIEPILAQRLEVGETVTLAVSASDPEGTQVFFAEIESSAETIATVESDGAGNLLITGIAPGQAEVTLVVEDGEGQQSETRFTVEVFEPTPIPNEPPIVAPIPAQSVEAGETITLPVTISDPEGTQVFFADIESSAETIATVESDGAGNLLITGIAPGEAQINLVIEDGDGEQTEISFTVLVSITPTETPIPNEPPLVEPIAEQQVEVGESITLPVTLVDPEGTVVFFAEIVSAAETIATAESDGAGNLIITGVAVGETQINLTIEDGDGQQTETSFAVIVFEPTPIPNEPPVIAPISDQTLVLGNEPVLVPVTVTDPEGTQVFFAEVTSAAETIATAESDGAGNLILTAVAAGETPITVVVEDGNGNRAETSFTVSVIAPTEAPNNPPVVEPILDQTLVLGNDPVTIPVAASDPEGLNPFFAEVTSAAETIATAEADGAGNVIVTPVSAGQTQITVVVDDGSGLQTPVTFTVTVVAPTEIPNEPPAVDPIGDQVLGVGESVTVIVNALDPEGFQTFIAEITSSDENIATATSDGAGNVTVTGVSAGQVAITAVIDDQTGKQTEATFQVLVNAPPTEIAAANEAPTFEAIPDQVVDLGGFVTVPIGVFDPENDPITLNASSSDETVAQVQVGAENNVTIAGNAPGIAQITVTGDDAQGNLASISFTVTVAEGVAPTEEDLPASPLAAMSELPDLSDPELLTTVQNLYSAGDPNVFIVVGDVTSSDLFGDIETGIYDLSGASDAQSTFDVYLNQPLEDGTVLTRGESAANPNWKAGDLINPANNPEGCTEANPIACAMVAYSPSVVVVMVGRNDVLESTPLATFEANLQLVVQTITAYGAIPVLTTIPGSPTQVDPYNAAIATLAANNGLPLWNLWRSIPVEQANSDLSLTSPGGGQNAVLTAENIAAYGTVKRNEMLLRLLQRLRENVPLQ